MLQRSRFIPPWSTLPGALYVTFIVLPLAALLLRATTDEEFVASISSTAALTALRLSLTTSAVSMAVILLVGTPLAYRLARSTSTATRLLDGLIELPIVLPPVVAGLAMLMAFGRRGVLGGWLEGLGVVLPFTTVAVIFAQTFVSAPFFIRSARLGFESVPRELEETSYTLGVRPGRTFWRVTLPLAWPSLVGGAALAWARALSEFGATIMFAGNSPGRTQTLPLAILSALESDLSLSLAMAVLLLLGSALVLGALMATRRLHRGPGV